MEGRFSLAFSKVREKKSSLRLICPYAPTVARASSYGLRETAWICLMGTRPVEDANELLVDDEGTRALNGSRGEAA